MSINSTYNAKLTGSYKSSAQVVIYSYIPIHFLEYYRENYENLKPIEESMNFKISFMPQSTKTVKNKLNMEMIHSITSKCLESFILSYSRDYICILSLNVSILVSNVDVPFYPQGIQYVGQMGT
ncbi:unnamed protein product [Rhizophagus irregularis]|uniref:Uncharacterized protein n=1 Tax=Rhizophagus irregularis TaxID=588596 RepID=A0A915ZWN0_9GLOM|nr:unnamed protein product [Rhizophagus irregularis]